MTEEAKVEDEDEDEDANQTRKCSRTVISAKRAFWANASLHEAYFPHVYERPRAGTFLRLLLRCYNACQASPLFYRPIVLCCHSVLACQFLFGYKAAKLFTGKARSTPIGHAKMVNTDIIPWEAGCRVARSRLLWSTNGFSYR